MFLQPVNHMRDCPRPEEYDAPGNRGDVLRKCRNCTQFRIVPPELAALEFEIEHHDDCRGASVGFKTNSRGETIARCQYCQRATLASAGAEPQPDDRTPSAPSGITTKPQRLALVCRAHHNEPVKANGKGCTPCARELAARHRATAAQARRKQRDRTRRDAA